MASRKGLRNQFRSFLGMRKGSASAASGLSPEPAARTGAAVGRYDAASPELQLRQLADTAFMLQVLGGALPTIGPPDGPPSGGGGVISDSCIASSQTPGTHPSQDYETAASALQFAASDFRAERAWKHYAGTQVHPVHHASCLRTHGILPAQPLSPLASSLCGALRRCLQLVARSSSCGARSCCAQLQPVSAEFVRTLDCISTSFLAQEMLGVTAFMTGGRLPDVAAPLREAFSRYTSPAGAFFCPFMKPREPGGSMLCRQLFTFIPSLCRARWPTQNRKVDMHLHLLIHVHPCCAPIVGWSAQCTPRTLARPSAAEAQRAEKPGQLGTCQT